MKTLLLPKILANEKGGGYVKPPMPSFSADAPPPPWFCTTDKRETLDTVLLWPPKHVQCKHVPFPCLTELIHSTLYHFVGQPDTLFRFGGGGGQNKISDQTKNMVCFAQKYKAGPGTIWVRFGMTWRPSHFQGLQQ